MFIRSINRVPGFVAGDRCTLKELLNPAKDSGLGELRYSLAHATVPKGASTARHKLTSSEVYYIISGSGLVHIDEEIEHVGPGDAVFIPAGAVQYIESAGESDLSFLCIVDPAWIPSCETVLD